MWLIQEKILISALPRDTSSPSFPANRGLPGVKYTAMPPKPKENSRHQPDIKFPVFILGIRGKTKVLGKENINWEMCFSQAFPWF